MAEGQVETWRHKDSEGIEVEAVRLSEDNAEWVSWWCGGTLVEEIDPEYPEETQPGINLRTTEGMARASLHMYVVKYGSNFFTIHNRPFEMAYEPVSRAATPLESAGDARRERGLSDPFDMGRYRI